MQAAWFMLLAAALPALQEAGGFPGDPEGVRFRRDVWPILQRSCLRCHGPERPRGGLRLDSRAAALAGGAEGPAILPGRSDASPIIHRVEHADPERRMPPEGKGDPLTPREIALLKSWIDQGASWEPEAAAPQPRFSFQPTVRFAAVEGDRHRFREVAGIREGLSSRWEMTLDHHLPDGPDLHLESSLDTGNSGLRLALQARKPGLGHLQFGLEQWESFYSDTGGAYRSHRPELNETLSLEHGRFWIGAGWEPDSGPAVRLLYEYLYKQGEKSILQWGDAAPAGEIRKIYPADREIFERLHRVTLEIAHEWAGWSFEDHLVMEVGEMDTLRRTVSAYQPPAPRPTVFVFTREQQDHLLAVNALRAERLLREWLLLSAGYLYSSWDLEASLSQTTLESGAPALGDYWRAPELVLDRESHLANVSFRLGPRGGWVAAGGLQSEWTRQEGVGDARLDVGDGTFLFEQPARLSASLDKHGWEPHLRVQNTSLPWTPVYAEGRFRREDYGQAERSAGGPADFLRRSDARSELLDTRIGIHASLWPAFTWIAELRQRRRTWAFDHVRDLAFGFPGEGYSAFLRERESATQEWLLRCQWNPLRTVRTALEYQWVETRYRTRTDPVSFGISPGGGLRAGEYQSHHVNARFRWNPSSRWRTGAGFFWRLPETHTESNGAGSVADFDGTSTTVEADATFTQSAQTHYYLRVSSHWTDFEQEHETEGLPLGQVYRLQEIQAGIRRSWGEAWSSTLQYGWAWYQHLEGGGGSGFSAHIWSGSISWKWP